MASTKARVYLHGRFPAGARVGLYEVENEGIVTHIGAPLVEEQRVDDDQRVEFTKGVKAGGYYLIFGYRNGQPLTIKARGKVDGDQESVIAQPPVKGDPQTFVITGSKREPGDVAGAAQVMEDVRLANAPAEEQDAPAAPADDELTGAALHKRAAQLEIEGRSKMTAEELRQAVKDAEAAQS